MRPVGQCLDGFRLPRVVAVGVGALGIAQGERLLAAVDRLLGDAALGVVLEVEVGVLGHLLVGSRQRVVHLRVGDEPGVGGRVDDVFEEPGDGSGACGWRAAGTGRARGTGIARLLSIVAIERRARVLPGAAVPFLGVHGRQVPFETIQVEVVVVGVGSSTDIRPGCGAGLSLQGHRLEELIAGGVVVVVREPFRLGDTSRRILSLDFGDVVAVGVNAGDFDLLTARRRSPDESPGRLVEFRKGSVQIVELIDVVGFVQFESLLDVELGRVAVLGLVEPECFAALSLDDDVLFVVDHEIGPLCNLPIEAVSEGFADGKPIGEAACMSPGLAEGAGFDVRGRDEE